MFRGREDQQIHRHETSFVRARRTVALAAVLALAPAAASGAADARPNVLPVQASPHGASYGEWGARWWQWALSAPAAEHPLVDATGEHCDVGQSGGVWFLAGTFGGSASRACTVPAGRALFFPVLNAAFIATEVGETEEMAHQTTTARIDSVDTSQLAAEIDGVSVPNLEQYRAHSPTFSITLPEANLFGLPAGTYGPGAADGYWLMLPPLQPGAHTVHFHGAFPNGPTIDVTYDLLVG